MARKIALLAESDPDRLESLRALIDSTGEFDIVLASDGAEAAQKAIMLLPDVIIVNAALPQLSGIDALERINAAAATAATTIVLSVSSRPQIVLAARNAGADYFFPLPYAPRALLSCVAPELVSKRAADALVTELLQEIGLSANLKGYVYVREAVLLARRDPSLLHAMTKALYPEVARRFDTSASCVERSIRHAVENLWQHGDAELLSRMFGATVTAARGKPTNGAFIAVLTEHLRLRDRPHRQRWTPPTMIY